MATQLQLRRGTSAENDNFTGAEGELTYNSTTKGLRIHNGSTKGGYLVDTVVGFQAPTAKNNYTWYRKYSSGWVEQGGIWKGSQTVSSLTGEANLNIALPMAMANDNFYCSAIPGKKEYIFVMGLSKTTTNISICIGGYGQASIQRTITECRWQVSGMAA